MTERIAAAFAPHKDAGVIATALLTEVAREEYRANAAECQEVATHWPDRLEHQYQELAHQWLLLAEQAERNSR
jgi:hypothetical protein